MSETPEARGLPPVDFHERGGKRNGERQASVPKADQAHFRGARGDTLLQGGEL